MLNLMFIFCSCKNSNISDYDNATILDSNTILVDSSSSHNKNVLDETIDDQLKRMQNN